MFNFDECGAPEPKPGKVVTYFQQGLSSLVDWRFEEARRRFRTKGDARDVLPVVVVSGTLSARMTLLRTASGRAKIFDVGRAHLGDESLLRVALNAIARIAEGAQMEVPSSAWEVRLFAYLEKST